MQPLITCLNGDFMPAHAATLPLTDRGFRFGDGVFETIRLVHGVPYLWEAHLSRLEAGLAALRITPPAVDWQFRARELVTQNRAEEGFLRLSVSRGEGSEGYLPAADIRANWAIEYLPKHALPREPFRLWLSSYRRAPLSVVPGNQKIAQGLTSTLALIEARANGCDEALLQTVDGKICSAAAANVFWITSGKIATPPLRTGCLAGTTRARLMELVDIDEQEASLDALENADAMFLTNTRYGAWPAASLTPSNRDFQPNNQQLLIVQQLLINDLKNYYSKNVNNWKS